WLLPAVGVIGWIVLGYFGYYLATVAPKSSLHGPAVWLGAGGGVLMGLSAVSLYTRSAWRRRLASVASNRTAWLVTAAGTVLALISLWLDTEKAQETKTNVVVHFSYWSSIGDHSLGITMLVLACLTLAALLAVLVLRFSALYTAVLVTSLTLLGISLYLPVSESFNHLGALRAGSWLALVGSLAAAAGAVALWLPEQQLALERSKDVEESAPGRARAALKGKKRRVPETRRDR
ncbi:MAG: hypothetical protein ACYDHO_08830, partial [Gaiellaceae bacterium]